MKNLIDDKSPFMLNNGQVFNNIALRDLFAMFAPEPKMDDINTRCEVEFLKAQRDDSYIQRSIIEVVAMLKYNYADAMLKEREPNE